MSLVLHMDLLKVYPHWLSLLGHQKVPRSSSALRQLDSLRKVRYCQAYSLMLAGAGFVEQDDLLGCPLGAHSTGRRTAPTRSVFGSLLLRARTWHWLSSTVSRPRLTIATALYGLLEVRLLLNPAGSSELMLRPPGLPPLVEIWNRLTPYLCFAWCCLRRSGTRTWPPWSCVSSYAHSVALGRAIYRTCLPHCVSQFSVLRSWETLRLGSPAHPVHYLFGTQLVTSG
jgi:hypothetical protein